MKELDTAMKGSRGVHKCAQVKGRKLGFGIKPTKLGFPNNETAPIPYPAHTVLTLQSPLRLCSVVRGRVQCSNERSSDPIV